MSSHAIDITKAKATPLCGATTGVCVDDDRALCANCRRILDAKPLYTNELPWAPVIGRRCRARLAPEESSDYFGRCELAPHDPRIEHALERGMVLVRWSSPNRLDTPHYETRP